MALVVVSPLRNTLWIPSHTISHPVIQMSAPIGKHIKLEDIPSLADAMAEKYGAPV